MDRDIYVLAHEPYTSAEEWFLTVAQHLTCIGTVEQLSAHQFKLRGDTYLRFWDISISEGSCRYPVIFMIYLDAETLAVREVSVIDDSFGQPHFVNEAYNRRIEVVLNSLIESGLFRLQL